MATEEQKAYTAGLIDGEGCIDISVNRNIKSNNSPQYYVRVTVHMTDLEPLEFMKSIWGGAIRKVRRTESYQSHWKDSYHWVVSSQRAMDLLSDIMVYLHGKKDQALVALTFKKSIRGVKISEEEINNREKIRVELMNIKKGF